MTPSPRSFAIVPACGVSRRMGADKLLLPWNGSTILETVVTAWQQSQVDHICVVIPKERDDLVAVLDRYPVAILSAEPRPADMKASIQLGLRELESQFAPNPNDAWLIAPADMPTLSAKTIDQVLQAARHHPGKIIRPANQGRHGHPALFPWRLAAEVFALPSDRGLDALFTKHLPVDVPVEELGEDVDTPEELERLRKALETGNEYRRR